MENFYDLLGVSPEATQEEIKARYRELAKDYHPDKHGDNPLKHLAEDMLKKINRAYETLGNPQKRQKYNQYLQKAAEKQRNTVREDVKAKTQTQRVAIACYKHRHAEAVARCSFCNRPLCLACASMFNISSCPPCLLEYNRRYLKSLYMPLVYTAIFFFAGIILSKEAPFLLGLYGVSLYWGWHLIKNSIFYTLLISAIGWGAAGLFVGGIILIMFAWIPGFFIAIYKVPILIYKLVKESKKVKTAQEHIRNMA